MNLKVNQLNKLFFPDIVYRFPENEKNIYLTFDDGPTPGITSQVLAFLLEYNVKATFFCRGDKVKQHPHLYKKITEGGHITGNHGYSHLHGWYTPFEIYLNDCKKASEVIKNQIFRPPYGKLTPKQYQSLKSDFSIYLWSALSWDFHPWVSPKMCLWYSLKYLLPGNIIVFHDTSKASSKLLYTLPRFIEAGISKGYQFSSLPVNIKNDREDTAVCEDS